MRRGYQTVLPLAIYRRRSSVLSRTTLLVAAAFAAGLVQAPRAEPLINEFMASNQSIYPDNSDFEDYSDWIELYNPDGTNVSLVGYYLTDDLDQPFKWPIPGGAIIPAGGTLMIRADGFDAGPGETHLRGYWPYGSTFQTRRYHANFRLSADVANWTAASPTPARSAYQRWAEDQGLFNGQHAPGDDPDGDGLSNVMEYGYGTDPMTPSLPPSDAAILLGDMEMPMAAPVLKPDLGYAIQKTGALHPADWTDVRVMVPSGVAPASVPGPLDPAGGDRGFYRLVILLYNVY